MNIRFASDAELASWDSKILSNPDGGNVFQSDEFADQKRMTGWIPRYVFAGNVAITILEKHIFGLGKYWYIPKGPGVTDESQLDFLLTDFKKFANKNGVFAVKIEPEIIKTSTAITHLIEEGLIPSAPIQPNFSTVLVDISLEPAVVVANLNQTSRHAIRRAEREGVTVEEVDADNTNCKLFYDMLTETASGSFHIRSYDYYYKFWRRYADAGLGQLFFAYHNDTLIAAAFAMIFG
ncbi:peptidoglycan bridge formation glycyltransferase FemA/FemB family protein, partial [Candidatus Saccharibacteria bacterium]|nr:peptidoglycan bridge formation glycyltransferase FemA/FemB family protein [Candidatus Saccharibacteria bacterium]